MIAARGQVRAALSVAREQMSTDWTDPLRERAYRAVCAQGPRADGRRSPASAPIVTNTVRVGEYLIVTDDDDFLGPVHSDRCSEVRQPAGRVAVPVGGDRDYRIEAAG